MKKCYNCNLNLPFEMFNKNRSRSDGLASECKKCKFELDKIYRENNKEKLSKQKQEYYFSKRDYFIDKACEYSKNNKEKCRKWSKNNKDRLKTEVFFHYCSESPKCIICKEDDLGLLSLDHINGDGAEHRKQIGMKGKGGYPIYQWAKKNNYPDIFQVLCFNCQFIKRYQEMKPKNPTKNQTIKAEYVKRIKIEVLNNYGGLLCPCGEKRLEALSLDHVNDDGANHRKSLSLRGYNFYHYLRKNKFPKEPKLQVLCMNCQYKKRNNWYNLNLKFS